MKARIRSALLGSLLIGCGATPDRPLGSNSPATALIQTTTSSARGRFLHEAQLQGNQRADFSSQVIIAHLESERLHPGDSGGVGYDLLAFRNSNPGLLDFIWDTPEVGQADILDSQGKSLFTLQPGSNPLELPAGDFLLRLTGKGNRDILLGVGQRPQPQIRALYQPGVYIQELSGFSTIEPSDTADTLFVGVGPASGRGVFSSYAECSGLFGSAVTPLSLALYQFFENGGKTATVLTLGEASASSLNAGLASVTNEDFNLLVLPDLGLLEESEADLVSANALALATANRAMFLMDLPESISSGAQAQSWLDNHPQLRQNQVAAYWPWLPVFAPDGSRARIGPSSAVAGMFARVDSRVGVWQTPAGLEFPLQNVDLTPSDGQAVTALNLIAVENGVTVAWGARTLSGQPIGPQRLENFLANSLSDSLTWTAFEPSDVLLFETVTQQLNAFLTTLWQQGALVGSSSAQAFHVLCDTSNNPPLDRLEGTLQVVVLYAPLFPGQYQSMKLTFACQTGI